MMNWIKHSLFNRLLAIIVGGCLLIVAASGYYFLQVSSDFHRYNQLLDQELTHERQIGSMLQSFRIQVQEWKNVLLRGTDSHQLAIYWKRFEDQERQIQAQGIQLADQVQSQEAQQLIQRFLQAHQLMGKAYREALDNFQASGFNPVAGDQAVRGIDREPTRLLDEAASILTERAARGAVEIRQDVRVTSLIAGAILLAAILVFVGGALLAVHRGIIRPSRQVIAVIDDLSQGRLDTQVSVKRADELGVLARAALRLQAFLQEMASELKHSTQDLDQATDTLASTAASVTDNADQVSQRINQMAAATQEMTAAAQEVASHAQGAAQSAQEVRQAAQGGLRAMEEAREVIERLSRQVTASGDAVNQLDLDIQNVGSVLNVIRGIAEQTNLLALNAAIEAARAGEQGRGFAVVADEVRTLAQRTQASTTQIQEIIESVQQGARNTVSVIMESRDISSHSVDIFQQAAVQLTQITRSIEDINDLNTQVATAAEEQASVADDIARDIADVSQQTEETAQAVGSLRGLTGLMQQMAQRNLELGQRFKGAKI